MVAPAGTSATQMLVSAKTKLPETVGPDSNTTVLPSLESATAPIIHPRTGGATFTTDPPCLHTIKFVRRDHAIVLPEASRPGEAAGKPEPTEEICSGAPPVQRLILISANVNSATNSPV